MEKVHIEEYCMDPQHSQHALWEKDQTIYTRIPLLIKCLKKKSNIMFSFRLNTLLFVHNLESLGMHFIILNVNIRDP